MTSQDQGPSPDGLLSLAVGAAVRAGQLVHRAQPRSRIAVDTKSSPTDVVTEMDRAAERLVVGTVLAMRPTDGVAGEEGGFRPGTSGVVWHVDPIDGTVNYTYGLPHYCVSIAAEVAGRMTVAAVFAPALDLLYTAVAGEGAYVSGERLHVRVATDLSQALIATGFGYEESARRRQASVVARMLPAVRDIRRAGSAALDLCSVAAGQVDGYWESGLHTWDLAAGGLVALEAGATVAGFDGAPAGAAMTLAAGPEIFPALHRIVRDGDIEARSTPAAV